MALQSYQLSGPGVEGNPGLATVVLDSVDPIIGLTTLGCLLIRTPLTQLFVASIRLLFA